MDTDRLESSRLVGLLLVVTMMAVGAPWLQPPEGQAALEDVAPQRQELPQPAAAPPDRVEVAAMAQEIADDPGARPASAALCLALEDKLRSLHSRASGVLGEREQLEVRAERRRSREHMAALRCTGSARAWF